MSDSLGDGDDSASCPECGAEMFVADPEDTPGPKTFECPECCFSCSHTHYCEDCETELYLMWDMRENKSASVVCGHCGGANTRPIAVTDGGERVGDGLEEEAARREATVIIQRIAGDLDNLHNRLDELAYEFDDEEARDAYGSLEEMLSDIDDVLGEAQEAVLDG